MALKGATKDPDQNTEQIQAWSSLWDEVSHSQAWSKIGIVYAVATAKSCRIHPYC